MVFVVDAVGDLRFEVDDDCIEVFVGCFAVVFTFCDDDVTAELILSQEYQFTSQLYCLPALSLPS